MPTATSAGVSTAAEVSAMCVSFHAKQVETDAVQLLLQVERDERRGAEAVDVDATCARDGLDDLR